MTRKTREISRLYAELASWEKRMVYAFHKWETLRKTVTKLERKADRDFLTQEPYNDKIPF